MDIQSFMFTTSVLSLAAAGMMAMTLWTRTTYPGFGWWTAGIAALAAGPALFFQGAGSLAILAGDSLTIGGFLLIQRGMRVFRGQPVSDSLELAIMASFIVVFGYASLDPAAANTRIMIYSLYTGLLALATAHVTLRPRPAYFDATDALLAGWLSFIGVLAIARFFHHGIALPAMLEPGVQSYYILVHILTVQLITLILISLNARRMEYDYRAARNKLQEEIAEQQRIEADLCDSEERLTTILDSVEAYIYIKDTSYRYSYANQPACTLFGKNLEDIIGHTDADLFDLDTASRMHHDDRRVLETGERVTTEEVVTGADGAIVKAYQSVKIPLRHPTGEIYALCGVSTDITARKAAEAALRVSEEQYRALVENTTDCIWEIDTRGRYTYLSPTLQNHLGYHPAEFLGRSANHLLAGDDAEQVVEAFLTAAKQRQPFCGVHYNRHRDGHLVVVDSRATPFFSPDGEYQGMRGISRDITEQYNAQIALRERNKEQHCLYGVFRVTEDLRKPLPDVLREVVELLPAGWFYPEVAVARIEWEGQDYATARFSDAVVQMSAAILVDGEPHGQVTVAYVETRPPQQEGPFLAEERTLLDTVAERLANVFVRRMAADRLRRARAFTDQLIETANVMILGLDAQGRVVIFNPKGEEITGYSRRELLGQDWSSTVAPPEGEAAAAEAFSAALVAGELPRKLENTIWTRSGAARRILWWNNPIFNPEGERISLCLGVDVTEQRQAERELAEYRQGLERLVAERTADLAALTDSLRLANEEQRAIFDAATVGIILARDRRIERCNRTMERLFGYGPDEMLGQSTRLLYADETTFGDIGQRAEASLLQQGFHQEELELVHKDGSRFWGRLALQFIDRQDLRKGNVVTFEDISIQRAAFAEMSRARDLAEAAAQTKANFLANMSHEIRTPLNAIIGMTHLALRTEPTPRQRDHLLKIQRSSQHLLGLINDILDFSRIEAGNLGVEQIDFDLAQVLKRVTRLMVGKIAGKALQLNVAVAADVPNRLVGDPLRLEQVLSHYADNAVKFTDRGEIAIAVQVAAPLADGVLLRFAVRDTGIGIGADQLPLLFQSFQQADASASRQYGGTGLGLALSKRLATLMGGEVGVESAPGQGSTFWFTARLGRGAETGAPLPDFAALAGREALPIEDCEHTQEVAPDLLGEAALPTPTVPDAPGVDGDHGRALCSQLVQQLREDDPASQQFLSEHEAVFRGILGAHFPGIAEAIERYDLELAFDRLQQAVAAQDIVL